MVPPLRLYWDNGKENGNYYNTLGGVYIYMGGCQNLVPFWIRIRIRPLIFRVNKKGTIILKTRVYAV